MLNTDLYNDQVKNKMTLQDFIRNNRGIDNNNDVPLHILEELFYAIQKEEINVKS